MNLSIESNNDNAENIKNNNNAKNIKIKNITDVKSEDKYYLKILNNNFNLAFKLNK